MNSHRQNIQPYVCATCLEDDGLRQFADEHGEIYRCNYCGTTPTTPSVVALNIVIQEMHKRISEEWCDPAEATPIGISHHKARLDSEDLFREIGFKISDDTLMSEIVHAFRSQDWCQRNLEMLSPSKRWIYGWETFQNLVKHKRRFTFWYAQDVDDSLKYPGNYVNLLPPSHTLSEIAAVLAETNLVKSIPVGTPVWRLQVHSSREVLTDPVRFTSPPIALTNQPNRMSPVGVPMFYGADDFETALLEVVNPHNVGRGGISVSGVQFMNLVDLNMLDLTSIPSLPSYFSPRGPILRHIINFLRKFTSDLSQPITADGLHHIEYIPTQVFTEFVRYMMKCPDGAPIHGIRYSSSRNGRPCCVIFATQEECLPDCQRLDMILPQMLSYVDGSLKSLKIR